MFSRWERRLSKAALVALGVPGTPCFRNVRAQNFCVDNAGDNGVTRPPLSRKGEGEDAFGPLFPYFEALEPVDLSAEGEAAAASSSVEEGEEREEKDDDVAAAVVAAAPWRDDLVSALSLFRVHQRVGHIQRSYLALPFLQLAGSGGGAAVELANGAQAGGVQEVLALLQQLAGAVPGLSFLAQDRHVHTFKPEVVTNDAIRERFFFYSDSDDILAFQLLEDGSAGRMAAGAGGHWTLAAAAAQPEGGAAPGGGASCRRGMQPRRRLDAAAAARAARQQAVLQEAFLVRSFNLVLWPEVEWRQALWFHGLYKREMFGDRVAAANDASSSCNNSSAIWKGDDGESRGEKRAGAAKASSGAAVAPVGETASEDNKWASRLYFSDVFERTANAAFQLGQSGLSLDLSLLDLNSRKLLLHDLLAWAVRKKKREPDSTMPGTCGFVSACYHENILDLKAVMHEFRDHLEERVKVTGVLHILNLGPRDMRTDPMEDLVFGESKLVRPCRPNDVLDGWEWVNNVQLAGLLVDGHAASVEKLERRLMEARGRGGGEPPREVRDPEGRLSRLAVRQQYVAPRDADEIVAEHGLPHMVKIDIDSVDGPVGEALLRRIYAGVAGGAGRGAGGSGGARSTEARSMPFFFVVEFNDMPLGVVHRTHWSPRVHELCGSYCNLGASLDFWKGLLGGYGYSLLKYVAFDAVFVHEEVLASRGRGRGEPPGKFASLDEYACELTNSWHPRFWSRAQKQAWLLQEDASLLLDDVWRRCVDSNALKGPALFADAW